MVYTVKDVQDILRISKNTAYALVRSKPFPVKEVKGQFRIPRQGFENWLMAQEEPPAS